MKTVLKWLGIGVSVIVGLAIIAVAFVRVKSSAAINRRYTMGVEEVAIPTDSASLARGRHLVEAIGKCIDCHGEDLGGTMFINDKAFGQIPAPNLTRGEGGRTGGYSDVDWVRSIRHAVKPDGRGAAIMPAEAFIHLGNDDLGAVIAYMKSLPPVNRAFPEPVFGPVARALLAFGKLPAFPAAYIDHDRNTIRPAPVPDTTVTYGDYLTQIAGCRACHNPAMSGGPIAGGDPASPPASNLTPGGIGGWTEADFARVLREGKRPHTEQVIDDRYMPWKYMGRMTDAEIHAIWLFLQSLPSKELGQS